MITDEGIAHKFGYLFLDAPNAQGVLSYSDAENKSLGTGTPSHVEVLAAAQLTGIAMATNDEVFWYLTRNQLWDADLSKDVEARLIFMSTGGASDTGVDFKAFIKGCAAAEAITAANSSADGSITFPAQTIAGANKVEATPFKPFNVPETLEDDLLIMLAAELDDSGDASADEIKLLGIELKYTRRICTADGVPERTS